MKKILVLLVFVFGFEAVAQSPIAYNLQAITVTSSIANSSPPGEWSKVVSDGAFFSFNRVAQTYGDPNRALPAEYYRIDAETKARLYNGYSTDAGASQGVSQSSNNPISSTSNFFDKRRMNGYYRDMEEWRRSERVRLKRYGIYDGDAIRDLYRP